jgi:hypothetical protein
VHHGTYLLSPRFKTETDLAEDVPLDNPADFRAVRTLANTAYSLVSSTIFGFWLTNSTCSVIGDR